MRVCLCVGVSVCVCVIDPNLLVTALGGSL